MAAGLKIPGAGVAATPYAKRLAFERGIDLASLVPSGKHGEIVAADVENARFAMPKASALAKRIAQDQGIDLQSVKGSGFGGKIMKRDLENVSAKEVDTILQEIDALIERRKMTSMRKVIAKRMYESHAQIPNVTQNIKVDVTDLLSLRAQINDGLEKADKVSLNDLMIKAIGIAIAKFERFRMAVEGEEYVLHNEINVAFAVGMDDGLLVPVIKNVDQKNIFQISKEAKELAGKARDKKLLPSELGDGRITISNLGMFGTHSFTPIINQPEASIVGVCGVEDELALINGAVAVRKKMMICITYDHRVLNGTEVAEFEAFLKNLLEHPAKIIL